MRENQEYDEYAVPIPVAQNEFLMEMDQLMVRIDTIEGILLTRARALHNFAHRVNFKITVTCTLIKVKVQSPANNFFF